MQKKQGFSLYKAVLLFCFLLAPFAVAPPNSLKASSSCATFTSPHPDCSFRKKDSRFSDNWYATFAEGETKCGASVKINREH